MKTSTEELLTRLSAVHGFSTWLHSTLPGQSDESREFSGQMLNVLEIYQWELERQLAGHPAIQDWYNLIAVTSALVLLLQGELHSSDPELKDYRSTDEPMTVAEMTAKLLCDALEQLEDSQNEMAAYLEQPVVSTVLTDFLQSISSV